MLHLQKGKKQKKKENLFQYYVVVVADGKAANIPSKAPPKILLQASSTSFVNFTPNFCLNTSITTVFRCCKKNKSIVNNLMHFIEVWLILIKLGIRCKCMRE